jgi:hypothetical protein
MTRLVWGVQQRKFEAGVDRGVLYPEIGSGVAWNGLVSVVEGSDGGELSSFYFDGIKFLDYVSGRTFKATLTAYTAPNEFLPCVGEVSVVPGFILTKQNRARFGLSYRTQIDGDRGYKIHIVYNSLATPSGRAYSSLNDTATADPFQWNIDTVPAQDDGTFKPSAHFVFDSTVMPDASLAAIEAVLYGTDTSEPRLPTLDELFDLLIDLSSLVIVPDTIGGLAELIDGVGDLYRTRIPGVLRALPDTRLTETVVDGLYELEP